MMTVGKPMKPQKRRSRRWRFILPVCLLVGIGIFIVIRMGGSPTTGSIVNTPLADEKDALQTISTKTLDTPFYSLLYPSNYELQKGLAKGAGQVDLQVLTKRLARGSPGSIRASLGVENVPFGGISEMSPYKLAKAFPASYKIESMQFGTNTATILTKFDDGSLRIALLQHQDKVLLMAISSQSTGVEPDYESFISKAASTLSWK